jgi:hypothetical protein
MPNGACPGARDLAQGLGFAAAAAVVTHAVAQGALRRR